MQDDLDIPSLFPPKLDEQAGPATPLSDADTQALVARAIRDCGLPSVSPPVRVSHARLRRRGTKRAVRVGVVVAALGFSGAAAALSGYWVPVLVKWTQPNESGVVSPPPTEVTRPTQPATQQAPATATSEEPPAPPPVTEAEAELSNEASSVAVPAERKSLPGERSPRAVDSPSPSSEANHREDALAEANALRAKRRYQAALDKYLQVVQSSGKGGGSTAARIAAASLLLDHRHDAAAAKRVLLPVTRAASAPPEAVFLLARIQLAGGDSAGARRTLRRFIDAYRGHPLEQRAKQRLEALGGATE